MGTAIDALDITQVVAQIAQWAQQGESRYVAICNAHSVVTAHEDPAFGKVLAGADLATPDGTPVAWMGRRLGFSQQQRVTGPDLMLAYCEYAETVGEPLFLFGSTPETLDRLSHALLARWPKLQIAGSHSPPFRPLSPEEDRGVAQMIAASGARTVWVSLGCPKQEIWMASQRGKVMAVMVGVGAAFDFHSGLRKRAPGWMQNNGLEWLFRLGSEPRRLWRRYVITNTQFIGLALRQLRGVAKG